jgi:hypothetical protein
MNRLLVLHVLVYVSCPFVANGASNHNSINKSGEFPLCHICNIPLGGVVARVSVVFGAACYMQEGRGFETRRGH